MRPAERCGLFLFAEEIMTNVLKYSVKYTYILLLAGNLLLL